jgi:hypothetical protein
MPSWTTTQLGVCQPPVGQTQAASGQTDAERTLHTREVSSFSSPLLRSSRSCSLNDIRHKAGFLWGERLSTPSPWIVCLGSCGSGRTHKRRLCPSASLSNVIVGPTSYLGQGSAHRSPLLLIGLLNRRVSAINHQPGVQPMPKRKIYTVLLHCIDSAPRPAHSASTTVSFLSPASPPPSPPAPPPSPRTDAY